MKLFLSINLTILLSFLMTVAQNNQVSTVNDNFDAAKVEVMVVGSYHLRQINPDEIPISADLIRLSLMKYKPDHIVVEWLHPSIDPATTFNYRPFANPEALARLWGYQLPKIKENLEATKQLLESQKKINSNPQVISQIRTELRKLYYLDKDLLNAGYQWWLVQQLGGDVLDYKGLALNNFRGHELEEFGFKIAQKQGLEYITPFDYQGKEAGSEVWGEIIEKLGVLAIQKKHGVKESDEEWKNLADEFNKIRQAFEEKRDKSLREKYGDVKEVREYIEAWEGFDWANAQIPTTRDGLSQMRYVQSPQYLAIERKVQLEIVPKISVNNLGQARTDGNLRRNELMMNFAEADIKRLNSKRVMIIVGYGHKFFLEDLLKKRGYKIVPSTDFMP